MSKTNKIFNIITFNVIILLMIGIASTYLSDYLTSINWFGDYNEYKYSLYYEKYITYEYWGPRHYWYNWGLFILFILSIIRSIVRINEIYEKN